MSDSLSEFYVDRNSHAVIHEIAEHDFYAVIYSNPERNPFHGVRFDDSNHHWLAITYSCAVGFADFDCNTKPQPNTDFLDHAVPHRKCYANSDTNVQRRIIVDAECH